MKSAKMKTLCAVCAAVLALGICPAGSASADEFNAFRTMGDADGDGEISVTDAQSVLITYVKGISRSETINAATNPATDTNLDGVIDIVDASNILKYYCKTLSGEKPLWSDFRKVTEILGSTNYKDDYDSWVGDDGVTYWSYNPKKEHNCEPVYHSYQRAGMFLEIGVASGKPGDDVAVQVYMSGVPVLAGCQMYLNESSGAELIGIRSFISREYIPNGGVPDSVVNPDPAWGALAWVAPGGKNIEFEDGSVIAEYYYHIPDDAVPGTIYSLSVDKNNTRFVTDGSEVPFEKYHDNAYYQFTLLDGAILVE